VDNPGDGPGPEVRSGTRTQSPRLTRHRSISRPFLAFPQEQAALGAAAADAFYERNPAVSLPDTPSGSGIEVQAELILCPWAEGLDPADRPVLGVAWKHLDRRVTTTRLYWNPEIVTEMLYELLRASLRVPDGSYGPY
jgi:hypothetical protein